MISIEKCPLCNGNPRVKPVGDWKEYFAVQCSQCGEYLAKSYEARTNPWYAILLWNRRAKEIRRQQNDCKSD